MISLLETLNLDDQEDVVEFFRIDKGPTIRFCTIVGAIILLLFFFMTPLFRLGMWGVFLFLGVLAVCGLLIYRAILRWMGTIYIATTARIIGIERKGFWAKGVREVAYRDIVHGQYSRKGIWRAIRDIGTVQCMLKSSSSVFAIEHIIGPQRLLEIISQRITFPDTPITPAQPESHTIKAAKPSFSHTQIPIPSDDEEEYEHGDEYWDKVQS